MCGCGAEMQHVTRACCLFYRVQSDIIGWDISLGVFLVVIDLTWQSCPTVSVCAAWQLLVVRYLLGVGFADATSLRQSQSGLTMYV